MASGKGEEWLVFVGGISEISRVRAGINKNPHEGGHTGEFHTVTYSLRRNEQNDFLCVNLQKTINFDAF